MSRARILYSEILYKMSPINNCDDKSIAHNVSFREHLKERVLTPSLNDGINREFLTENINSSRVFLETSEINLSVDEWLKQKTGCITADCIDGGYLNDGHFLMLKDSDMCSSDINLNLAANDKREEIDCIIGCNTMTDCVDPLLSPINDTLMRKPGMKCDRLLGEVSEYEINMMNKNRLMWDTLSFASRRSDCDIENSADFGDFNLLSFSFDTNDHITTLDCTGDNGTKSTSETLQSKVIGNSNSESASTAVYDINTNIKSANHDASYLKVNMNSVSLSVKAQKKIATYDDSRRISPTILQSNININVDNDTSVNLPLQKSKTIDNTNHLDVQHTKQNDKNGLIFDLNNCSLLPTNISNNTEISNSEIHAVMHQHAADISEEQQIMKMHRISEISNMTGMVAVVSNCTINSKNKTKVVIKTENGDEKYEGNTADLMDSVRTNKKNCKCPTAPMEGKHVVTSVKTAANILEENKNKINSRYKQEPEDELVQEMLGVLGITDDMLYTVFTNLGLRMWVCPEHGCRRIFNRLYTLKSHILSHYGLKPFKCDFPNCPWSFYTSFKLKRHRETHLKRKDFLCSVPGCNRTFTTIYNLNTHLKLHERPAKLKCLVRTCSCKFQTRRAMETHLKTHEISVAPYKCTHDGCDKLYYSFSALTAHSRCHQHKEEELRCQWENCGRLFDKPCRLKAHLRQHTGDRPYACDFKDCKWAFSSSSKLKRHQHKHNNERKFRCTIDNCTKAFMRSEHLKEHTLTHIGDRTFQCSVCGEKCAAKSALYVHKRKFHPNETPTAKNNITNMMVIQNSTQTVENSLSKQKSSQESAILITFLPENSVASAEEPVIIKDKNGKEYELRFSDIKSLTMSAHENADDIRYVKENPIEKKKLKLKKKSDEKDCARTVPYEEVDKRSLDIDLDSEPLTSPTVLNESFCTVNSFEVVSSTACSSDFMLDSEILQNSQESICIG